MIRPATFALALIAVPAFAQAPKWTAFAPKGEGFSILMPGPTQVQRQSTQGVTTNIYLSMSRPFVCAVSKTNLPPGTKSSDIAQLTSAMKRSMLATSHSTATGEHAANYGGLSGRQTDFKTSNGTGAMWIAQTPHAVYSVTIAKQGAASPAEIKRFYGSFRAK